VWNLGFDLVAPDSVHEESGKVRFSRAIMKIEAGKPQPREIKRDTFELIAAP
jgi:hypothetical protein